MTRILTVPAAALAAVLAAAPAAAFTPILVPGSAYVAATTLLGTPSVSQDYDSWTDGTLTVDFSSTVVGYDTADLAFMPNGRTEGDTIAPVMLLADRSASFLQLSFDRPLRTFGFEIGTEVGDFQTYTVRFFNGPTLLGTISEYFEGDREIRLFAASAGPGQVITHVTTQTDWGPLMGRLRYQLAPTGGVVPEPASWAMLILGFGLVGASLRRQAAIA